ncbi:hypothetical protein L596_026609 [Steinernema carpocapsae]|uniref:Uncharacterized protein n=1 Tax=Steinernema carpocapsae TaxID=34508 RepID=A0A4V5ZY85_STECR|nr:hypothetical protein L596_026609 [Steinernema carpocapsae]
MTGYLRRLFLLLVCLIAIQETQSRLFFKGFHFRYLKLHRHRHENLSQNQLKPIEVSLPEHPSSTSTPPNAKQKSNNLGWLLKQPVLGYQP